MQGFSNAFIQNWKTILLVILGFVLAYLLYFNFVKQEKNILSLFKKQVGDIVDSQNKKRLDFQKQIQQYYQEIQDFQMSRQKRAKTFAKLGRMFRDGVPDKYDKDGNKIKGVIPDPNKAMKYFEKSIRSGLNAGLYELAKLFHYGMHNLEPQLGKAIELYEYFLTKTTDVLLKNKILDKIRDAREKMREDSVYKWLNLPGPDQKYLSKSQKSRQMGIPATTATTTTTAKKECPEPIDIDIQGLIGSMLGAENLSTQTQAQTRVEFDNGDGAEGAEGAEEVVDMETQFYNDAHNVHDSGITATIKKSIDNLQKVVYQPKDVSTSLGEIRNYIVQFPDNDKKKDALSALDSMERSVIPLSSTKLKEVDALNLVWSRIHQPKNIDNKETLKENLYNELAECIEHDKPVCSTGKFTRILDTLNVVDPEVTIKPGYVLQQEMLDKAGKIQSDMMKNLNNQEKALISSVTENEFQNRFIQELRKNITDQLYLDYVKSGTLSEQHFQRELGKWINDI